MVDTRSGAFAVLLLIFLQAVQGCGTDVGDPSPGTPDTGPVGECPGVPCLPDETCVGGQCIVFDGCIDEDGDGFGFGCDPGEDCADDDETRFPGAAEECNEIDDDCDLVVDEDGVCNPCTPACEPGEAECSGERIVRCDDSSGCPEWASPVPCPDGLACAAGECVETCQDADNDGFPVACPGEREDCDDSNPATYPRAFEICDGEDNDCDDEVDESGACDNRCDEDECVAGTAICSSDATAAIECILTGDGCAMYDAPRFCGDGRSCVDGVCIADVVCVDHDGDGHGPGCEAGADCRGADPSSFPGAPEVCDGLDNDCDGVIDDGGVCAACTPASAAAPIALDAGVAYRVSCGGLEHFTVGTVDGPVSVLVASTGGRLTAELGTLSGGVFTVTDSGNELGIGTSLLGAPGSNAAVRVNAPAGVAYVVSSASASACIADGYEPNNAPAAGTPAGRLPYAASATICGSDTDFFEVEAIPGQILSIATAYEGASTGDLLPKVWRNGSEVSIALTGPFSEFGFANGRHSHFRMDLPGTYVVGVRGRIATAANEYAVAIMTHESSCSDDAGETIGGLDDDTIGTARSLALGATTNATLCPGDIDVLDIGTLAVGQTYAGTLTSTEPGIEFFVVRDSLGSVFHDGISDDPVTEFSSNVSTAGHYYAVIFGSDPAVGGSYSYAHSVR